MNGSRVTVEITEGIAAFTLDRPEARNAMDPVFVEESHLALDAIEKDARVRAILVSGTGPSFCVGGDMKYFASRLSQLGDMAAAWHGFLARFAATPVPVVTAVHGGTAGGGLGFIWCADYAIAAESTKLATGFADLGLPGDGGATWYLPRLVGLRRAQELILDNRVLDAATALEWGVVNRVVPDALLAASAREVAHRFAARSATAFRGAKRLLLESSSSGVSEQLDAEVAGIRASATSADAAAGLAAFVAKQRPEFPDAYFPVADEAAPFPDRSR